MTQEAAPQPALEAAIEAANRIIAAGHPYRTEEMCRAVVAAYSAAETPNQIKHMVDRFLSWRLPENFRPDCGISFRPMFNEHTAHPSKAEPTGTNLFDATQVEAMVRYMIGGMPEEPVGQTAAKPQPPETGGLVERLRATPRHPGCIESTKAALDAADAIERLEQVRDEAKDAHELEMGKCQEFWRQKVATIRAETVAETKEACAQVAIREYEEGYPYALKIAEGIRALSPGAAPLTDAKVI